MPRDLPIENWAILLLFVVLATFVALTMVRRGSRRGITTREVAREQIARLRDQREIRDSMDALLVRLEEFSRQVNGQLDTKFARLEQSIRDADQRTDRLRKTIAEHDRRLESLLAVQRRRKGAADAAPEPASANATSEPRPTASVPRPSGREPRTDSRSETQPHAHSGARPEGRGSEGRSSEAAKGRAESSSTDPAATPPPSPDRRFSRVYDLADAGISAAAIAEQVEMPVGEVELILNLRQAG